MPPRSLTHNTARHRRYGDQGGQGGLTHVAQLLEELSEFPIAGCYEDVMWEHDMVGYEELRRRANRPIGLHHFPLVSTARGRGSASCSGGKRSEGPGFVRRA